MTGDGDDREDEDGPIPVGASVAELMTEVRSVAERARPTRPPGAFPRPRSRGGRPAKLTPAVRDAIVDNVLKGAYLETAALAAGVAVSTFHSWKARANEARSVIENAPGSTPQEALAANGKDWKEEARYLEFLELLEAARAWVEGQVVHSLQRSALGEQVSSIREWEDDDGTVHREIVFHRPAVEAQKFFLERSFRDRYGTRVEVGGPDGGAIPVEVQVSAREALKARLELVAERIEGKPSTPVDKVEGKPVPSEA